MNRPVGQSGLLSAAATYHIYQDGGIGELAQATGLIPDLLAPPPLGAFRCTELLSE